MVGWIWPQAIVCPPRSNPDEGIPGSILSDVITAYGEGRLTGLSSLKDCYSH